MVDISKLGFVALYDEIAEQYDSAHAEFYIGNVDSSRVELYKELRGVRGLRVLDIGCGPGKDFEDLSSLGAVVSAIDISKKMIDICHTKYPNNVDCFSVQDFNNLNFEEEFFDVIFSRYVLQYSTNLDETFEEMGRVLKPNGMLVAVVAHPLLGFVTKPRRFYWESMETEIALYDGACTVREPTHTLDNYLSPSILRDFVLEIF